MSRTPWYIYLWPGLPQLWRGAGWSALGVAVGFAALLNLALASSLLWSELLSPLVRIANGLAVAAIWICSAAISRWTEPWQAAGQEDATEEAEFSVALDHYLKGNWFEAESTLNDLLGRKPRDVDAGLMLATLFRRTRRYEEALGQLDRLECTEDARKWELEIRRERELLAQARAENAPRPDVAPEADSAGSPANISDAA